MKIFVVNCGSSSIKYQLFDMTDESVLGKGILERLGSDCPLLRHISVDRTNEKQVDATNHTEGMKIILDTLVDPEVGVIRSIDEIDGVGHRVVHGGEQMTESITIDGRVIEVIETNSELAPLHNPPNLSGIRAGMKGIPGVPHVAVFDTAFLTTLPPRAYRYAVPTSWYTEHHVRRYGFHGTSHRYVTLRAAELLGKKPNEVNLITGHLGNGCSMTAVAAGKAVDHSMGMTPLCGLVMGTRSGDLDPAIVLYMISRGMTPREVDDVLNKRSGMLGVSEVSNDMRDVLKAAGEGDSNSQLAIEMFVYSIVRYVGAYRAILPPLDAIVLTGGIGENSAVIREEICAGLGSLGVVVDHTRNTDTVGGQTGPITSDDSQVPVWVIPTNEELMIARDTERLVAEHIQ